MEVSVNDRALLRAEVREALTGAWTARIEVDEEDSDLGKSVAIKAGAVEWKGTVLRGKVESGRYVAEVVGGAGKLEKKLKAQYYVMTTFSTILQGIISESGEQLDAQEHDTASLAKTAQKYQRTAGTTRVALSQVAQSVGCYWRVTRSGGIAFIKKEKWAALDYEHAEELGEPGSSAVHTTPKDEPDARPGTTVATRKVSRVVTRVEKGGVSQDLTADDGGDDSSHVAILSAAVRRAAERAINYSQIYPSKIVQQDPDGTVHLMPDDERVRGNGLTKVPLRHGLPGLTVKVVPGQRAALFFEDGDPQKPACGLWPDGSSVMEVVWETKKSLDVKTTEFSLASLANAKVDANVNLEMTGKAKASLHGAQLELKGDATAKLMAPQISMGPGQTATQPFVRGTMLMAYLDAIFASLSSALLTITPGPATGGGAPAAAVFNATLASMAAMKTQVLSLYIKGE